MLTCRPARAFVHLLQGSTLRLEVAVSWVLSSTYNSTFGTTVIEGNSDYRLSGTLLAQV